MNILEKTEEALANFIAANDLADVPSNQVYAGLDINDLGPFQRRFMKLPWVICRAEDATDMSNGQGGYLVDCSIMVVSKARKSGSDLLHEERVKEIFGNIKRGQATAQAISELAEDYTAFAIVPPLDISNTIQEDGKWISELKFRIK